MKAFRWIHVLSLLSYVGATLHGVYSGTDTPLPMVQWLYKGTSLIVIFLTVFWLVLVWLRKVEQTQKERAAAHLASARRHSANR